MFEFLRAYGYPLVFLAVLGENLGLPLPSFAVVLAAASLAAEMRFSLVGLAAVTMAAALLGDVAWYILGRFRGRPILRTLCSISLNPDSCVSRTENLFERHGLKSLLAAKVMPGLNTRAPPLAGMFGMRFSRFLLFDGIGAVIYNGLFVALGFVFSRQLEKVAQIALGLGAGILLLVAGGLGAYIAWKYVQRQRFMRSLRVNRITAEELKQKIDAGDKVAIVDLRHAMDFEADPNTIPGALFLPSEEFDRRHHEIPVDRELILFCT